jgi:uncharacterized protein
LKFLSSIVLLFLTAFAFEVSAVQKYEDGLAAYRGENYTLAAKIWASESERNNRNSQYGLSLLYLRGDGVQLDTRRAFELTREAANKGLVQAQKTLGSFYLYGIGGEKNIELALDWLTRSAKTGYAKSQIMLGNIYRRGIGVAKNLSVAVDWYKQAAATGDQYAEYFLAFMHYRGAGVPKDNKKALRYFSLAARKGHGSAQFMLGSMFETGRGLTANQAEARRWYVKAARAGLAKAQHNFAVLLARGEGGTKDTEQALIYFEKAAKQGLARSQFNVAALLSNRNREPNDLKEALFWTELAVRNKVKPAIKLRDKIRKKLSRKSRLEVESRLSGWKPLRTALKKNDAQPVSEEASINEVREVTNVGHDQLEIIDNEVVDFLNAVSDGSLVEASTIQRKIDGFLVRIATLKRSNADTRSDENIRYHQTLETIQQELEYLAGQIRSVKTDKRPVETSKTVSRSESDTIRENGRVQNCSGCPVVHTGKIEANHPLRGREGESIQGVVAWSGAKLLAKPGNDAVSSGFQLTLGDVVTIFSDRSENQFVLAKNEDNKWGWLHRKSLLFDFSSITRKSLPYADHCDRYRPSLKLSENRKARKSIIKVLPVKTAGSIEKMLGLYSSPNLASRSKIRAPGSHPVLYVFATCFDASGSASFLVGTNEHLDPDFVGSSLLGWINRSDVFLWENANALSINPASQASSEKVYVFEDEKSLLRFLRTSDPKGGVPLKLPQPAAKIDVGLLKFPVLRAGRRTLRIAWVPTIHNVNIRSESILLENGNSDQRYFQEGWISKTSIYGDGAALQSFVLLNRSKLDVVVGFYANLWRLIKGRSLPSNFVSKVQKSILVNFGQSISEDQTLAGFVGQQMDALHLFTGTPLDAKLSDIEYTSRKNSSYREMVRNFVCATYKHLQMVQESKAGTVIFGNGKCKSVDRVPANWWLASVGGSQYAYIPARFF